MYDEVSWASMGNRGYRTIRLPFSQDNQIAVYTSARAADALEEITADMTLYKGVRLLQVMEAVYRQGKIDGARTVFDKVDEVKEAIPHRRPGRPRVRR